jgi:hypothetical protein
VIPREDGAKLLLERKEDFNIFEEQINMIVKGKIIEMNDRFAILEFIEADQELKKI